MPTIKVEQEDGTFAPSDEMITCKPSPIDDYQSAGEHAVRSPSKLVYLGYLLPPRLQGFHRQLAQPLEFRSLHASNVASGHPE